MKDWLRFQFAWAISWPLWMVVRGAARVALVHDRIIDWGERSSDAESA